MSTSMDREYLEYCQKDELTNPDGVCAVCEISGVHNNCEKQFVAERHLREQKYAESGIKNAEYDAAMLKQYSLSGDYGCTNKAEFLNALTWLQKKYPDAHSYDFSKIIESENWWFIPRFFIGRLGYIVEKESNEIFSIGSGHGDVWDGIKCYLDGEIKN